MQLVIVGAGGFATQVIEVFQLSEISIYGLADDRARGTLFDIPILGTVQELKEGKIPYTHLFCAIGDVKIRKEIYESLPGPWMNCIHPKATVSPNSHLGVGNYVGPEAVIMPRVNIGDNNIIDPLVFLSHDVKIGNHNHLAGHSCILGRVSMKDCNLIGGNSTVLPDIAVGSNNILGAGAVATRLIGNNMKLKGIPAK